MPSAVRVSDMSIGHGCFTPHAPIVGSPNVFTNKLAQHRENDSWSLHCCGVVCHPGTAVNGSSTVFVNGKAACRTGDQVNCGTTMTTGSPNVFIGG